MSESYIEDRKKVIINFRIIESAQDRALRLAGRHRDKEICQESHLVDNTSNPKEAPGSHLNASDTLISEMQML